MLDFRIGTSRETRLREAADWLSQRMQGGPVLAYSGEPPIERKPPEEDPDGTRRRALQRCLNACDGDEQRRLRFCRRLPDPKLRRTCTAIITMASKYGCRGWCYNEFGD